MPEDDLHPSVSFAVRYEDASTGLLSAHTAIARLESLTEDIRDLRDLFDKQVPKGSRCTPWVGAEIVSYYAVGFVTCLSGMRAHV